MTRPEKTASRLYDMVPPSVIRDFADHQQELADQESERYGRYAAKALERYAVADRKGSSQEHHLYAVHPLLPRSTAMTEAQPAPSVRPLLPRSTAMTEAQPAPSVRDRCHELKTWPAPFQAMALGLKPFELRKDDRGYRVSDLLVLKEWDPQAADNGGSEEHGYTGRSIRARITYVTRGAGDGCGGTVDSWVWNDALDSEWAVLGLNVFSVTGKRVAVGSVMKALEYASPQVLVEGEAD